MLKPVTWLLRVCVCAHMHTSSLYTSSIHMCQHKAHIHTNVCIHTCVHTRTDAHTSAHKAYVHRHVCIHTCARTRAQTGTYAQAYTRTHIFHTHVQTQGTDTHKRVHPVLCTHRCTSTHICTHQYTHMHTHMCVWTQRNLDLHGSKLKRCTMRTFRQLDPSAVRKPKPGGWAPCEAGQ